MTPNSSQPAQLIKFENVATGYGSRQILSDINFSIASGDYLAIVGSNGSGKTTLLRTLLGLLRPLSGQITPTVGRRLHFGYVPQLQMVEDIFPISALDVVVMGLNGRLGALRRPGKAEREKALSVLEEVGIAHMAPRLFRELSGGQKQRTLIARALAGQPDILVLDEHTNDLDIAAERSIMALIDRLHAQHQLAIVMVTHSLNTVVNHAHHLGLISKGKMRLETIESVMRDEHLDELYGVDLQVVEINGRRVVI